MIAMDTIIDYMMGAHPLFAQVLNENTASAGTSTPAPSDTANEGAVEALPDNQEVQSKAGETHTQRV